MIAPWRFKCENLHLQFEVRPCKGAHMSIVLNRLSVLPKYAKISNRYVLTVSKIQSTCHGANDFINSHEAILKVVIELDGVNYFFPVFAVVDAPHSIVRGAWLGYEKNIGIFSLEKCLSYFMFHGLDNRIRYQIVDSVMEDISLYPHLTYRDYRFQEFESKGLSVLDISNQKTLSVSKCMGLEVDLPILKALGIQPVGIYKAGLVCDEFTVSGAHYV